MQDYSEGKSYSKGLRGALGSAFIWGALPIYWSWLQPINSGITVCYRVFLSAVFCVLVAWKKYGLKDAFEPLKNRKLRIRYILAGLVITFDWAIYLVAVNNGYLIQASMGYYIEPLVVCLFGAVMFKEKLSAYGKISLVFVVAGVIAMIVLFGEFPTIAILIALSFPTYAAIKKAYPMPPERALLYETIFIAPIMFVIIMVMECTGHGAVAEGQPYQWVLMLFNGVLTAYPLMLYTNGINHLNLFTNGLIEYITPTITLLTGIFLFKEDFEPIQTVAFGIIWIGLIIFSYGEYEKYKEEAEAERKIDA